MQNHDWIELFRMIPADQQNTLVLTTMSGVDLNVEVILRTELTYLVFRGRVSGITEDLDGNESRSRLRKKCEQVLTHARVGFASVTTFKRLKAGIVHSYLHFAEKPRRASKVPKKKGKVKKRKRK